MHATKILPPDYTSYWTLDFSKSLGIALIFNFIGLGLFFVFGWLFLSLAAMLRPDQVLVNLERIGISTIVILLGAYVGILVLHELIHGLFFWFMTHERPYFGVKAMYAYASAPDWYLPRNPYLLVGIAPFALITLIGIFLIPFVSPRGLIILLFAMTVNAGGAVGDLFTVAWLLTQPVTVLVRDSGDSFTVYSPTSV